MCPQEKKRNKKTENPPWIAIVVVIVMLVLRCGGPGGGYCRVCLTSAKKKLERMVSFYSSFWLIGMMIFTLL